MNNHKGVTISCDDAKCSRICHDNVETGDDETSMTFKSLDGSLTGKVGSSIVSTDKYLHDGQDCKVVEDWNMSICRGHFARVR